jgi:histidine triad (HIT) family protein
MSDCVFCQIAEGEIPADVVYEDETVVAFLDANPLTEGHTLVVPREHMERVTEITEDLAGPYFEPVPAIADAVQRAVDADGATIAWNDGSAAGQEVPHAHLHIVPRWSGDGHGPIHALFGGPKSSENGEKVAKRVQAELE